MSEPTPAEQADEIARLRRRLNGSGPPLPADQLAEDATRRCIWAWRSSAAAPPCWGRGGRSRDAISAQDCEGGHDGERGGGLDLRLCT